MPDFILQPTERDRVLDRLLRAKMTPKQAEEWALKNHEEPFASRPEPSKFDPMKEIYWTTPMVFRWIRWRSLDAVRDAWDRYRQECTYFEPLQVGLSCLPAMLMPEEVLQQLLKRKIKGHVLKRLGRAGLIDVTSDLPKRGPPIRRRSPPPLRRHWRAQRTPLAVTIGAPPSPHTFRPSCAPGGAASSRW